VPREKLSPDEDFFKALGFDMPANVGFLTKLENHFRVERGLRNCKALPTSRPGRQDQARL